MKVSIGISNRHVHLTREHINILFGCELENIKDLVQIGEFASKQTVTIKTEKSEIPNVRVLGPARSYTQVEISRTDSFKLGLNPPVRESGDIKGSEPITLIGPKGTVTLTEGCIIANRHIHMNPDKANELGLKHNQIVSVKIDTIKGGILNNVYIKVTPKGVLELHLDHDDANAFMIDKDIKGEICL